MNKEEDGMEDDEELVERTNGGRGLENCDHS